ncbi:MAG: tetraacyldisaccharide 4'-kinase [Myxococcota bacterium]
MNAWPLDLALLAAGRWPGSPERLGWRVPPVQPGAIWIHGASLGEGRIARRLADALELPAFVTTDTDAGRAVADLHRPVDHPWVLAPLWAEARPRLVVFVEGAWYPGLARMARAAGVPVVSVAARPGRHADLRARVLGVPDVVYARDARAAEWFADRGARVAGISGSLKGGVPGPNPLQPAVPFVAGLSTRPGDEVALREARDRVLPGVPLLIAPRHLHRIPELLVAMPDLVLRSRLSALPPDRDVLVDTHGELDRLVVGAGVAFIGGTLDARIGGHSPAEARWAGVPVVHGPETLANAEDFEGCTRVSDPSDLARGLALAWGTRPAAPEDPLPPVVRGLEALAVRPAPESAPRPWARPLALVQRAGMAARRIRSRSAVQPGVPVVAVGSHNARGSGKTSTALWVADRLAERGHVVGIATRGHGRASGELGESDRHGPDAHHLGDEGALFALRGYRVAAHPDRRRAVQALRGCTVLVLEDGLQTASIAVDLRIETVDARFPGARGTLPAGEGRGLLTAADVRVSHHADPAFPVEHAVAAVRRAGIWSPQPPHTPYRAFAGIGRNADFFAGLDPIGVHSFPDHHTYSETDVEGLRAWSRGETLVTTDRDAVRLAPKQRAALNLCWRGVELDIPDFPLERLP